MHSKNLQIKDFTYDLPESRIAKYPLPERDLSKLLIYRGGEISEDIYRNIAEYIPENSLLVFNDTKVIQARMFFKNAKGEKIEIFCLEPAEANAEIGTAMSSQKTIRWNCLVGRMNKWKEKILEHKESDFTITAEVVDRISDSFVIEFRWTPEHLTFAEILDKTGMMPIPPYLHRESEEIDFTRYQTIYAKSPGSVAAPTAGLHFTERVFESLKMKNIGTDYVTLHVGAGTFKPVKTETMGEHEMHAELMDVKIETIEDLAKVVGENTNNGKGHPVIAIGTTSLRTLESLYWMGMKVKMNPEISLDDLEITQWEAYGFAVEKKEKEALNSLVEWMKKNRLKRLLCRTQIMIAPGYELKIVDILITNFHQPNSTLLLLVAAIIRDDWKRIYEYALNNQFRFLSYGDGCLIFAK